MTSIISNATNILSGFNLRGRLRQYLAHAAARATGTAPEDLSPRLRYDIGLSDEHPGHTAARGPSELAREMMRRGF